MMMLVQMKMAMVAMRMMREMATAPKSMTRSEAPGM